MQVYKWSLVDIYYSDREPDVGRGCIVEINKARCTVKYDDETRATWIWAGNSAGLGHYVLKANQKGCEATLHRLKDSVFLEGYWKEHGFHGMWRIRLKEQP